MQPPINENALIAMALLELPGFGPAALRSVLFAAYQRNKPLRKWIDSSPEALARALDARTAALIVANRPLTLYPEERALQAHVSDGGRVCLLTDAAYPKALKDLPEPPPMLFFMGNGDLLARPAGAVVGARKATPEGLHLAAESATILAAEGPVVSGGADGVDITAHESAVDCDGGETIIVLPQGIRTYGAPSFLHAALDEARVLAVSAERPFHSWETHQAVGRNPIIAALARVVVVIEPNKTGGSIRTAEAALEMGREVFVWGSARRADTVERLLAWGAQPLAGKAGAVRADAIRAALHAEPERAGGGEFLF